MKNGIVWALFGPLFLFMCLAGVLASTGGLSYRHWQAPDIKFVVERDGTVKLPGLDQQKTELKKALGDRDEPLLQVDEATFNFGLMNPSTEGQHDFVIHNRGKHPLTLKVVETSCGCTSAETIPSVIEPGQQGLVRMTWLTGRTPFFVQHALLQTNDPLQRELKLNVEGQVQPVCLSLHAFLGFGQVDPGQNHELETYVYSPLWNEFEIQSLFTNVDGLNVSSERVTDEEKLAELEARCAYRITVQIPETMDPGAFSGLVEARCVPIGTSLSEEEDENGPQDVVFNIAGRVLGRFGFYGSGIDSEGLLQLGVIPQGEGKKMRYVIRTRDAEVDVEQIHISTQPEGLICHLQESEDRPGTFFLDIEVPKDFPVRSYLASNAGTLKIDIDHPKMRPVTFTMEFVVIAGER